MSAACRAQQRSNRTRSRAALLTTGAAVAALVLSACGSGGTSGGSGGSNFVAGKDGISTVAKGSRVEAPDLSGPTVDGKQLDVKDYKGKIVVVNVWGSWCPPCRAEAPNFVKVAKDTAAKGVQFVGINTRDANISLAQAFEKQQGVTYPSLYDPTSKLLLRFKKGTLNLQTIPSTIVIDRDGKIAARTLQALSEDKLREMLDPVLAEK
ncbi:TlpA family protein disulfide reductase [Streptomyces sp. NBC_01340]|uniref:TlpA family protein disulfide reductase n=1 Tax=unclassified Streptomyces TaxID=2593676 RepID=UPI0022504279|nr:MULTISPECIES: TlpA disulfide reductase family protein [unclassified Streptomyces]MCX4455978.1 TlpA family protein disulfide reductase [Streptomyces sp. NBC_01719]MCX4495337.1 TlpA family protein disulfide reductase [Streptomyces sp. NBC_01728]MCX4590099.1 TlpA family protein disulfide reductase [Streptomyces sp. NBC_01549]MCX5092068.1 TlpA family protein disulfide reductase [Streptomyces sp. NBC_00365]WSI40301.1 TlpA family protein disulfide reductase [Streptomyces sp. NBC_01340]